MPPVAASGLASSDCLPNPAAPRVTQSSFCMSLDVGGGGPSSWASLNQDILERVGCELSLRDLLRARLVCRQWHQHVAAAVKHLPHGHQDHQRHLVELDAQPACRDAVWQQSVAALATCLPNLSEVMVYVSSRVSAQQLGAQLRSLPNALTSLTKLELRYIVPSSAPCIGTSLQQLQPALTALNGLDTLYLIMGASPEPVDVTAVLPALSRLRDLKLLSGLPQFGFTNAKLEALGCATQLQSLHLEVSGVGQVDVGLAALSRLSHLRQLWLDGLVTLGPAVVCALQQLPELQELRIELDSPQHIPELFALSSIRRLSLTYHGDELEDLDDEPPDGLGGAANNVAGGGSSTTDWDALERVVRGHLERPVLCELGLLCCSFPADPVPRLALLTTLTSLTFYDCRWRAAPAACAAAAATVEVMREPQKDRLAASAMAAVAAAAPAPGPWAALSSLVRLQGFGMAQCVVPPISEFDLASLASAWPGVTALQLQSTAQGPSSRLPLSALRQQQPTSFGTYLSRWSRLEALTLSGSSGNGPPVALDVSLLPPSLTSLIVSSATLINSTAARVAIIEKVGCSGSALSDPAGASIPTADHEYDDDGSGREMGNPAVDDGRSLPCGKGTPSVLPMSELGNHRSGKCDCSCCCARASSDFSATATVDGPSGLEFAALEHMVLGEVCLGAGVSLPRLVRWAPNLRSLEINNLVPSLTDDSCTALAALTALTVLRVSQDQQPEGPVEAVVLPAPGGEEQQAGDREQGTLQKLSGMGLTALTGLRNLRQLEWLPWGCEPLDLVHVEALSNLRRLHLITLRGARDGAITERALEALRDGLPLCDIDDIEWAGLVDV